MMRPVALTAHVLSNLLIYCLDCVVDVGKMAESEDFIEFLRNRQVSEKVLETLKGPPIIYPYLMLRQPFMSLPFSAGLMTVRCI